MGARLAELVGGICGLLLLSDVDGVARRGEEDGGGARPVGKIVMRVCHELVLPAETLVLELADHPCTSLSALQARWNKRVMLLYSL